MPGHSKWSEIKRQKDLIDRRKRATQACRRMIARGERPLFRPRTEADGRFILIRIPELELLTEALRRRDVHETARSAIAAWLDVAIDSFDVEVEEPVR